ncbi:hypothetical protein EGM97_02315 [Pseudomonas sp. AF32]|uniref:hypothetical protein n=1 Tax=Pseudomonas sp. AF32 TaxID=554390 RepID=UPI001EEE71B1|nr:hypothetical protein [Pseudomonas sp. AF32]MCG6573538.1 hypothetical protein [Pseudomonas sp. AF32]
MSAGDDVAESEPEKTSGEGRSVGNIDGPLDSDVTSLKGEIFLEAVDGNLWANFTALYTWSPDGRSLELTRPKYSAKNNGSRKGNVRINLISAVETGMRELTNDDAIQDGQWHEINTTMTVAGNASFVEVYFKYTYDKDFGDPHLYADKTYRFTPGAPIITGPSGEASTISITVTGTGGVHGTGAITVHNANGDGLLRAAEIQTNGSWRAIFDIPSGVSTLTFYALQKIGNLTSAKSNLMTITLAPTTLVVPALNAVVRADQLVFKGAGFPGAKVWAVVPNYGTELSEKVTVPTSKTWEARGEPLSNGVHLAQAAYQIGTAPIKYTEEHRPFTVLDKLSITGPSDNQDMSFTVSGNNGLTGASVDVKVDFDNTRVGDGEVGAGGAWSARVQMPKAGPTSLVAEQTYQGVTSQRSVARAFKIKPPKLTNIQVTYPSPGVVRFSGAGYESGTRVEIFVTNGALQVSTNVVDRSWSVDWPDQPPASARQMNAQQGVADGGGWIYSDRSDNFTVTIPVPIPTLTVDVGPDRKPVFSGTGHSWTDQPAARIEVRRVGESTPAAPIASVNNNTWSTIATEAWNPGIYFVEACQLFRPAGESSDLRSEPTPSREFTIRAPVPTVEFRHDGLTPHFSGTCLDGGQVQLWFDGDSDSPYDAVVSGTTWTFTRDAPFMPGAYTARVKQSFGGQTSDEVPQRFDIVVLKPLITYPVDEDVDHNPIIRGTGGIPRATMRVHEFVSEGFLGEAPVTGDEWSVPILEDLSFGDHKVYAVQQYGEFPSEKSDPASFKVILFPPTIDRPQPGDALARVSIIDGHARKASGVDTATVELWLDGADEPLATVRARGVDGYWSYETHLPVGDYTLRARQVFQGKYSDFGPDHEFTAVPAIPLIESPALQQHLGARATISGHGYVGDWVEVAWSDAPDTLLGRAQVQANRTWSIPLDIARPAGSHSLMVQQECDGYRSGWSAAHEVLLLSPAPTFTTPDAGRWFAGQVLFEGTGETGKGVDVSHWFDARQLIARDRPVSGGAWTGSPEEPLAPGSHWAKARQSATGWGDSPRFEVAQVEESPTAPAVSNR